MKSKLSQGIATALLALAACPMAVAKTAPLVSQADLIKQSAPSDWRRLDPENTLVMEINGQQVILELAPRFAPKHAANIRTLAREGYYTGSAVVRVQDNYVTQWADPADEEKEKDKVKPMGTALTNLPAEFPIPFKGLPLTKFTDPDGWAPVSGFVDGMPTAEQAAIEIMRTDTATWRKLVEASRHAIGGWAVRSALHSNICNRTVPTRPIASPAAS